MTAHRRWMILAACALGLVLGPTGLAAQRPAQTPPADPRLTQGGFSTAEIIERLRASGMSRQQVRAELQRRGYDPWLADPYFDLMERSGQPGRQVDPFIEALTSAGMARDRTATQQDRTAVGLPSQAAELDLEALFGLSDEHLVGPAELPVFGMSFFGRGSIGMDEAVFGPVPAGYRLGPGDEINVILTGAVQDVYPLRVTREGTLVVPDVGQLPVTGLTLGALEDLLRARFAEVHSSGLTRVSVGLGQVRTIEVFVVGDVQRPGPVRVSALATVLTALLGAGGPSATGSFREIEIRRGSALVRRVDLYEYLLHGYSSADVRLQHGDVLFVPPVGRRVRLQGAVKRPAIYELLEGDGLRGAIRFAGGPAAEAALRQVQIDRVVPPLERAPGVERVLIDVDIMRLLGPGEADVPLHDGDRVQVYAIGEERRNIIALDGEVRRPGKYAWSPGTTLAELLERAAGVTEAAYLERAHVFRFDSVSGSRRLISVPLSAQDINGIALEDRDSVVVYSRHELGIDDMIAIGGQVKNPGRYPLPAGATLNDMILAAGGFAEGAHRHEAYVARPNLTGQWSDTTATTFRIPLARAGAAFGLPPEWRPEADEFALHHGDIVHIRPAQGYAGAGTVDVEGEVMMPGTYVLETRAEQVASLLAAAGGLTADARAEGLHVVRGGQTLTAHDSGAVLGILLQDGDSIRVPRLDPTILVTGAVTHDSTRVVYRPGMTVRDVVREAGGFSREADPGRLTVTYQNGQRGTVQRMRLQQDRQPEPQPGSTVHVPERPAGVRDGPNWTALVSQAVAAVGAIATLLIALNQ